MVQTGGAEVFAEALGLASSRPRLIMATEGCVPPPGGTYLAQLIGPGTQRELYEFMMGPQPLPDPDPRQRVAGAAAAAGLTVLEVRHESLPTAFYDVGAVVHFLRKVVWTVPDFTIDRYRHRLAALHDRITTDGWFVSHAQRMLVEARKPPAGR